MLQKTKYRPLATGGISNTVDLPGGKISVENSHSFHSKQVRLVAELHGDNECRCEELGITVTANAPALALARELLRAGCDPDEALTIHRRGMVALTFRSLGEVARLVVKSAGNGAPIFALDAAQEGAAAPPMRKNGGGRP